MSCFCVFTFQDVADEMPTFNVSYKPQKISPKFEGSVRQLLHKKIRDSYLHPQVSSSCMQHTRATTHVMGALMHTLGAQTLTLA